MQHVRLPDRAGRGRRRAPARSRVERIVAVHDIGRIDQPAAGASSQVEGGVLQGLGFALIGGARRRPDDRHRRERATSTTTSCRRIADVPGDRGRLHRHARPARLRRSAPRASASRRSCRPRAAIANAVCHATGVRVRDVADHAPPLPRGARRMSAYAPPRHARRGARAARRGRRAAARAAAPTSCRCRRRGKARRRARRPARRCSATRSSARATASDRRRDARRRRRRRREHRASATPRSRQAAGLAASPQLRNQGTVGGQPRPARALLVLPPSRPDLLARRRRHLLRADRRPPQARPRGRGLHLGRALRPRRRAARARRERARRGRRPGERSCRSPSSTRGRREDHRSAVQLARGELITAVELPAPPDASAYERAGERAAWSFALDRRRRRPLRRRRCAWPRSASRTSRACSIRPIRWPACRASSRPAGSASSPACCASARSPASLAIIRAWPPTTSR